MDISTQHVTLFNDYQEVIPLDHQNARKQRAAIQEFCCERVVIMTPQTYGVFAQSFSASIPILIVPRAGIIPTLNQKKDQVIVEDRLKNALRTGLRIMESTVLRDQQGRSKRIKHPPVIVDDGALLHETLHFTESLVSFQVNSNMQGSKTLYKEKFTTKEQLVSPTIKGVEMWIHS